MSWRIVPLLMLVIALAHFNRISISVAGAEQIIRPGLVSETEMGLVYSVFLVLYTIFMIPGGWFADRFGPRAAWMILGFGSALGVALTGLAGSAFTQAVPLFFSLLIVRSLLGMVNAPLHPSGARMIANWVPPQGVALANGLVTFSACVGIASTYLVFGALMDHFGWPKAFLVSSGFTFLVAVVWWLTASDYPPGKGPLTAPAPDKAVATWFPKESVKASLPGVAEPQPSESWTGPVVETDASVSAVSPRPGSFLDLLRHPSLLCMTLSYGLFGYFQYLFFYWAPFYFDRVLLLPKEVGRRNATLLTLAMGAGMILGGWLSDRAVARFGARLGLAVVPVVGLLLAAVATLVGAYTPFPELVFPSFAIAMAAGGSCEGAYWTTSIRIGGARGGFAAAVLNTGGNGVGLLAPAVTPAIAELLGWQATLALGSGTCVASALLWGWITPSDDFDHLLPRAKDKDQQAADESS